MHFEVDSLSFRGMILCLTRSLFEAVGTIASQYVLTGFKSVSLGFSSAELCSKQSFGISDSIMYGSAGSSKGGGSIGLKLGSTNGFIRLRDTEKQLFIGDCAQLKMNR